METLHGKASIVTGASKGIGSKISKKLAANGSTVFGFFRSDDRSAKLVGEEIESAGGSCEFIKCDISDQSEYRKKLRGILGRTETVDILINNAGIIEPSNPLEDGISSLERMMKVNVYPILYAVQELRTSWITKGGRVVNIASNAAIGTALDGYTYYAVAKAAVIALTRRLAFDLRKYGTRVNAIAPGTIDTEMMRSDRTEDQIRETYLQRSRNTELGRVGKPAEIAEIALFLASESSSFVTGQVIVADGGRFDYLTHG